jgi:hypothetical protein
MTGDLAQLRGALRNKPFPRTGSRGVLSHQGRNLRVTIHVCRSSAPTVSRPAKIVLATEARLLVLYKPAGFQDLGNKIEPGHIILMSALAIPESAT